MVKVRSLKFGLPTIAAMICMITSFTSDVTTALNATPMTTATARSSTFPRMTNARKSFTCRSRCPLVVDVVPPCEDGAATSPCAADAGARSWSDSHSASRCSSRTHRTLARSPAASTASSLSRRHSKPAAHADGRAPSAQGSGRRSRRRVYRVAPRRRVTGRSRPMAPRSMDGGVAARVRLRSTACCRSRRAEVMVARSTSDARRAVAPRPTLRRSTSRPSMASRAPLPHARSSTSAGCSRAGVRGRARHRARPPTRDTWPARRAGARALGTAATGCAVVLALLDDARSRARASPQPLGGAGAARVSRARRSRRRRCNHPVARRRAPSLLDFAWPDRKVAVEFDGFEPHSSRRVFDDDRARQNDLVDDGLAGLPAHRDRARPVDPRPALRPIAARVGRRSVAISLACERNPLTFWTEGGGRADGQTRSTIMAMPWPPPTHMLSMP